MITNDMQRKDKEYYELHIAGLTRQLQKFSVSDTLDIAAFILFGDVELVERCSEELLKKVPEFDYIVTPEAKSIPLAYEMSRLSGKKYIVARKAVKVYMDDPVKVSVTSITTQKEQTLYLNGVDAEKIRGKRVAIIDDVIATGDSVRAVEELVKKAGAEVVARAAILAELETVGRDDVIYLKEHYVFRPNEDGSFTPISSLKK